MRLDLDDRPDDSVADEDASFVLDVIEVVSDTAGIAGPAFAGASSSGIDSLLSCKTFISASEDFDFSEGAASYSTLNAGRLGH